MICLLEPEIWQFKGMTQPPFTEFLTFLSFIKGLYGLNPHQDALCTDKENTFRARVTRSSRFVILNLTIAAEGHHSSLWPQATTFERSQRAYLRPEATTIRCSQRPQHLKSHRTGTFWLPCSLANENARQLTNTDHLRKGTNFCF